MHKNVVFQTCFDLCVGCLLVVNCWGAAESVNEQQQQQQHMISTSGPTAEFLDGADQCAVKS